MTSKHKLKVKNKSVIISLLGLNHKQKDSSKVSIHDVDHQLAPERGSGTGLVVGFLTSSGGQ